ncbi:MAG TPA: DegV family protein [Symbiobacteriaceae bacterium]
MSEQVSAIVVADGGVDLPEGYAEQTGLRVVPLVVHMGSRSLQSGVDITPAEFFALLRNAAELPTTSQPSVGDYVELFREAGQAGLPILSYHLSRGLSGSIRSAEMAKQMLPDLDIRLIDTGTVSVAMSMQVMVAAEMARRGADPDDIIAETRRIGEMADLFFTVDKLDYLRKGGRIGRVAAYVGNLLGIRPIVTVDKSTGTYVAAGRGRSFRQAIQRMAEMVVERIGEGNEVSLLVVRGDCPEEADRLLEMLRNRLVVRLADVVWVNPSLGVHVGPDALGVACYPGVLPVTLPRLAMAL